MTGEVWRSPEDPVTQREARRAAGRVRAEAHRARREAGGRRHPAASGFRIGARVTNHPDGIPGDAGLFFSWPREPGD